MSTLVGYAYVRGSRQEFYDPVDEYDQAWSWIGVPDPRHRLNVSVVWSVPVGYLARSPIVYRAKRGPARTALR